MKISSIVVLFLLSVACVHNVRAQTAQFPGALATDANLKVAVNGVNTLLTSNMTTLTTTFSVSACAGIVPNNLITIDQEIMPVSGCSGTVLVVGSRGFDSTSAATHTSGTIINSFVDAWYHNAGRVEIEAIESALGTGLANVVDSFNSRAGSVVLTAADVAAVEQDLRASASPTFVGLTLTGNETVGGTLGVTGTLSGAAASFSGTLGVTGVTTLASLGVTGNETVGGTLGVTGLSTLASAVITTNALVGGTLGAVGVTTLAGMSATTGTFSGALQATSGTFSGNVYGAVGSFSSSLSAIGLTTLTGGANIPTGGSTTISTGVGSVKMTSGNAATNTAWIPLQYAGTTYYLPAWTTNAP